jgi:hypothetical protein
MLDAEEGIKLQMIRAGIDTLEHGFRRFEAIIDTPDYIPAKQQFTCRSPTSAIF